MESSKIKVCDLSYSIYEKKILSNIDINIFKGDMLGIVGPNGAGKTTLLKVICGILNPSSGTVSVEGKDINSFKLKELFKRISYLSQNINFNFPFKVSDVVLMGRYPYLKKLENEGLEDFEIARKSLEMVDMQEFVDRNILTLSGGEQQRVSLARVITQKTDFLFLDEPLSNMDINHQLSVMNLLRSLSNNGRGVSAVLHDLRLAYKFCSKVLVLNNGKVVDFGDPKKVLNEDLISSVFKVKTKVVNNSVEFIQPI